MLAELDGVLGDRAIVLVCLREAASRSGRVGLPIAEVWDKYCANIEQQEVESENVKDAENDLFAEAPASSQLTVEAPPEGTFTGDGHGGLFRPDELAHVEAPTEPVQTIYVHFEREEDIADFGRLIGYPVSRKTKFLSFPLEELFPDQSMSALAALRPEEGRGEE